MSKGTLAGIGVAALLVLAAGGFFLWKRGSSKPAPGPGTVAVQFASNLKGARIMVDGTAADGESANLATGAHTIVATLPGYKPIQKAFNAGTDPSTVDLTFVPEPQVIRVSAEMTAGKVMLDGAETGSLQEGMFTSEFPAAGAHTLKLSDGRSDVLTAEFQSQVAAPAKLTKPIAGRDLPVVIVSHFGSRATVYSSVPNMKASLKTPRPSRFRRKGASSRYSPGRMS